MKIARVFPRRTTATPDDELAFFDVPGLFPPEVDEVHISIIFTYDYERGMRLADEWQKVAAIKMGGPGIEMIGEEFEPGMYLRKGYVITSRGCPKKCWFCRVWKREGRKVRELKIKNGWNVIDDNLLACSEKHIKKVFAMLKEQSQRAKFTGGLDASLLKNWHIELLAEIKPDQMYFAYDTPDDYEPLVEAGKKLWKAGFKKGNHNLGCYVLIGYEGDTFEKAESRIWQTIKTGFFPFAMLYKNHRGITDCKWRSFQRQWIRPHIVGTRLKNERINKCANYV